MKLRPWFALMCVALWLAGLFTGLVLTYYQPPIGCF